MNKAAAVLIRSEATEMAGGSPRWNSVVLGCLVALATAHALTTPVSMVLTPSTGGLGVQRWIPNIKKVKNNNHFYLFANPFSKMKYVSSIVFFKLFTKTTCENLLY